MVDQYYNCLFSAFVDQLVGTGLLLLFINALIDPRNKVPKCLHPIGFGLAIFLVTSSFGMVNLMSTTPFLFISKFQNLGAPINPARDFGPRLFTFIVGYGWKVFS